VGVGLYQMISNDFLGRNLDEIIVLVAVSVCTFYY